MDKTKFLTEGMRNIIDSLTDGVVITDSVGKILYLSKKAEKISGIRETSVLGVKIQDIDLFSFYVDKINELILYHKKSKLTINTDLFEINLNSYSSANNKGFYGYIREKKTIHNSLLEDIIAEENAKERFNKIFRHSPALMAINNLPKGEFVEVNDAFVKKTGFTRQDLIGKPINESPITLENEDGTSLMAYLQELP